MPRFDGELVEPKTSPRFSGEPVDRQKSYTPTPGDSQEEKPKLSSRAKEVAKETGVGAVAGFLSPEIMTGLGLAAGAFPLTAPAAPWLLGAGTAARLARPASTGLGALGGAIGETSGQIAELSGASPAKAEMARFAGGFIGPEFFKSAGKIIQYGARKLLGLSTEGAVRSVMADLNINDKQISPSQKEYIRKLIEDLRGSPSSDSSQKTMYDIMSTGAKDIVSDAEKRAAAIRQQGKAELTETERRAEKMRGAIPKIEESGKKVITEAESKRSNIGNERESSDIGTTLRDKIYSLFSTGVEQRSAKYKAQEKIRDNAVAVKESSGTLVKELPEYKSLLSDLRDKLLIGKIAQQQTTAPVTEKGVLQAYQNIYDAVSSRKVAIGVNSDGNPVYKTFPTAFHALDDVRRRLGDAAYGKEVEGYSAIGVDIAKKYYRKISEIQSKFAGEGHDVLQRDYEMASRLLDKYKSKAGQKTTALDRFDPTRYKTDASAITNDFFKTKQGVADLIELTGNDRSLVLQSASDHAARELRNKDASGIKKWIDSNSDWLKALPEVDGKVNSYLKLMEKAETTAGKTGKASKILGAREPRVLREGINVSGLAETEAGKITEEASKRVNVILGDKFPAQRVKELFLSGSKKQWDEVAPILARSPQGKKAIADAVQQVMASRAETGLVTAPEFFRDNVRPALKSANLMSNARLDEIQSKLELIKNSSMPDVQKMKLMQRLFRNSISGYLAPLAERSIEGLVSPPKKSSSDVINQKGSINSVLPRFSN